MKKKVRILSMVLSLSLVASAFTGTLAHAEETDPPSVISLNDFDSVTSIEKYSRMSYEIEIDKPEVTLEVSSSNEEVLKTDLQAEEGYDGYYEFTLEGWEEGEATVTFTASDGTTVSRDITVEDSGEGPTYTIESDTTEDFTVPADNSRYITIHYENNNWDYYSYPTLTSDHPDAIAVTPIGNNDDDFFFRIDAKGEDGGSATLSVGSSDYVLTDELCKATVAENSNLRIDTKSTYVCNVYDTYDFVVYTDSDTEPDVTAANDLVSIDSVGKVDGGYAYEMTAEDEGDSLVQATLDGETAGFAVKINYSEPPSVVSNTEDTLSLEQGKSYTYKFSIMGGGEPEFIADTAGVFTVQPARKDGIDYYVTVTATGEVGSSASLLVTFPQGGDDSFTVNAGTITVAEYTGIPMTSDTTGDLSVSRGNSYVFKVSGATSFYAGTSGVFAVSFVGTSGEYTFYRITAIGQPGQSAGIYMSNETSSKKVCVATVTPVQVTSDTNADFELASGASYQFKITAPGASKVSFDAGTSGVVQVSQVKWSGSEIFYKVTAVGKPGQQTGIYVSADGQPSKKLCVVTVGQIPVTSDTTGEFKLAKGGSYQFKITAPGAASISFVAGTSGVVQPAFVQKVGSDFYYKVTGTGSSGQQTGIYVSAPNQDSKKVCVVTIK